MLVRRAEEMEGKPVDMEGVKGVSMRLMVGRDDGAPNFSMRHFTVEPGGHTPRHRHNYEHEVYVVDGAGQVESEGAFRAIRAGDVLYVEANTLHQFVNDGAEPLKFLCFVPSQFDCGSDGMQPTPGG